MRNRLDNILLGLLWLLAMTLATSFWFNTWFGFNIFSAQHWQYLAHLQANQTPVLPLFYISMGVAIFITISGLYMITQPRFKRILTPRGNATAQHPEPKPEPQITTTPTQTAVQTTPAPQPVQQTVSTAQNATPTIAQPESSNAKKHTDTPVIPMVPLRPPRLNIPHTTQNAPIPQPDTQPTPLPTPAKPVSGESPELQDIFKSAGYVVKKSPFITGFQPGLFAIGMNEVLWIGSIGVDTKTLRRAIDKLNEVFTDTLDDIYINVNGFAINAPDAATSEFEDILMFDNTSDLAQYINNHKNPQPTADEQENFDAYSEYIDTVIGYIRNL